MGLIALEGMRFYAHHGYYKEERKLGGQYDVDVYLRTDFLEAAEHDKLEETIDYEQIYAIVKSEMKNRYSLLEHIAKEIQDSLKSNFPGIRYIRVRVSKLNPPLKGNLQRVFVEIEQDY